MATEDAERSPPSPDDTAGATASDTPVTVGRYSWRSFLTDRGHEDDVAALYADIGDTPAVPASAVAVHRPDGADDVIRAAGVDEAFEADGNTAVTGHGEPSAGTLVVGSDQLVLSGATVVPDGPSTAAVEPNTEPTISVTEGTGATGAADEESTPEGSEDTEAETNGIVVDSADGSVDEAGTGGGATGEADAGNGPSGDGVRADHDETGETDDQSGIAVARCGVDGAVVVAASNVETVPSRAPTDEEWGRVDIDPSEFLGFDPDETAYRAGAAGAVGDVLWDLCDARYDLYEVPVLKGYYTWDDYRGEFFLDEDGDPPTDEEDEPLSFTHEDKTEALGFDPDRTEELLGAGGGAAADLADLIDERTVNVNPEVDEDAFFSTADGHTTLANRYDMEKAVPMPKKTHFREIERYWVNKPYSFVMVFRSTKENEVKYYAVQPYRTEIETELTAFLTGKLRTSIKYADESIAGGDEAFRKGVIVDETLSLLDRYDLYESDDDGRGVIDDLVDDVVDRFGFDVTEGIAARITESLGYEPQTESSSTAPEILARPEPAVLAEDSKTLSEHQVEKLLYYLKRDFIGYERIDPIKYDINVEDISCDGYNSPVFVYHSDYEQIITNIYHGTDELDDFVVKLAQRSGKGISKRRPQVDATLPDGSRAQLTLGREVSDHGTNYTIRQFNDVPFTPIDLINWKTFSLDEMAFLWLSIENHKSLIFAGGTASGKTTSLNAVSLFIPSNAKIVSIEDTREVELPQRNWIASVTRPSFSDDNKGDIDEFDLLEAALRQRPDYIVMGEIRGEEGRTAFQVMSTGHTTYTTFHADSVGEVLKRFTTDPINVSKTMFTALDLVSVQTSTRVQGQKVRRNKSLTEINHYDAENDEINVQDVFQWQAETDEFLQMGDSNTLEDIMFDRGWNRETLDEELQKRRVVLAYLIDRGLNSYAQVAATFQAFINDPETVLALMANEGLERSLEDLREMESVLINVDRDKEEMVPRPDPDEEAREEVTAILDEAEDLFAEYRGQMPDSVANALLEVGHAPDVEASPDTERESLAETARDAATLDEDAIVAGPADVDRTGSEGPDTDGSTRQANPPGHDSFDGVADETTPEIDPEAEPSERAGSADASGLTDPTGKTGRVNPIDGAANGGSDDDGSGDVGDVDTGGDERADDAAADSDGIDFEEPFDDGIDVLDPAMSVSDRADTDEAGAEPDPPERRNGDGDPVEITPDGNGSVDIGAESDDANTAGEPDESAGEDGDDRRRSDADGDVDDDSDDDSGGGNDDGNSVDEEGDADDEGDIDDWGFGSVESPEER